MPVEVVSTPLLPGLSPVAHKPLEARFDGGQMSSDGGVLLLREVEQRLGVAGRLAGCLIDPRDPTCVTHRLDEIIRFRLLMIAAGYEDGNDATALRSDPMLKLAMDRLPSEHDLCSQSTISRLENLADARSLLRMGRAMVDLYCDVFRQVPGRIVLDIDDTFDAVHGGQQLRLFNAHYDENTAFSRSWCSTAKAASSPRCCARRGGRTASEIRALLRRLVRAIRANWPRVEILIRADSHYCCPEVLSWCRANRIGYLLGVASDQHAATPYREVGNQHGGTLCRGRRQREVAPVRRIP